MKRPNLNCNTLKSHASELDPRILNSQEVKGAVTAQAVTLLNQGEFRRATALVQNMGYENGFFHSSEVKPALINACRAKIEAGKLDFVKSAVKDFAFDTSDLARLIPSIETTAAEEIASKGLGASLRYGTLALAQELKIPFDWQQSAAVNKAIKDNFIDRMGDSLSFRRISLADELPKNKKAFFEDPEVRAAIEDYAVREIADSDIRKVSELGKELGFDSNSILLSPRVQEASKQRLIYSLSKGLAKAALELGEYALLPDDFLKSKEVETAASSGLRTKDWLENYDKFSTAMDREFLSMFQAGNGREAIDRQSSIEQKHEDARRKAEK